MSVLTRQALGKYSPPPQYQPISGEPAIRRRDGFTPAPSDLNENSRHQHTTSTGYAHTAALDRTDRAGMPMLRMSLVRVRSMRAVLLTPLMDVTSNLGRGRDVVAVVERPGETRSTEIDSDESGWSTTAAGGAPTAHRRESAPARQDQRGRTTIAPTVVQQIARITTEEVFGVYAVGGGMERAFGAIRERIPGASASRTSGVVVEVGETQAAIDIELVAEHGAALMDLAQAVRSNVITAVQRMTGLEVVEVNIAVNDVHLPDEEDQQSAAPARVE
ncbi:Asp23/Gls24 family envelope stress response protein [Saccharopolyspora terrae]